MLINLGNIVFGGKGNGGGSTASAYVVPNGMSFGYTTLTEFPTEGLDFSQKTNFYRCWNYCSSLTSFPMINTANGTNFTFAWGYCSKLKEFPALDLSKGTNFESCWYGCSKLTSFPVVDFSNGETFESAWDGCSSLTTFPKIEFPKATNFMYAWQNCTGMTTFEGIIAPNATSFYMAWAFCSSLVDFPETRFGACSLNSALGGCTNLKSVHLTVNDATDLSGLFALDSNLEDAYVTGLGQDLDLSVSDKITRASLLHIISNMQTVEGKTLTLGSTNLAKLLEPEIAIATNKGWTLA